MSIHAVCAYSLDYYDEQYSAFARTPDNGWQLRRLRQLSRQARADLFGWRNVAYGQGDDDWLDIYPPTLAKSAAPVFVYLHGGYWRSLSKDDSSFIAPALTRAGATVVLVDYDLAPAVTLDIIVDQARRALAWIHSNIGEFGGDPSRLCVAGTDAGGHLVGMLLAGDWHEAYGVPADVLRAAMPISGLFDLRPLVHTCINSWLKLDQKAARRNSAGLSERSSLSVGAPKCNVLVAYGEGETDESRRQSIEFSRRCKSNGHAARAAVFPGANHLELVRDLGDATSRLHRAALGLMGL